MTVNSSAQGKTINVASSAQLTAALKVAGAGDTISLRSGNYGDVIINRVNAAGEVTIRSADADNPATFNTIKVMNSSNLSFDYIDVAFKPTATTVLFDTAVSIIGSSKIALTNSTVHGGPAVNGVPASATVLDASRNVLGLPTGYGVTVTKSSDITLAHNDVSTFAKGIVLSSVNGIAITENSVHEMRTSVIAGGDVSNAVVDGNHLYHSTPWSYGGKGDHGDFLIFWTTPTQGKPSDNITITNNFIDQGKKSPLLGIYLDDNNNKTGYTNVNISNNVIANGNALALLLENVKGTVSNNTLIQPRATDYHSIPGILLKTGSQIDLVDNILGRVTVYNGSNANQSGNQIITRADYAKYFANALAAFPTLADLVYSKNAPAAITSIGADVARLLDDDWGVRHDTVSTAPSVLAPQVVTKPAAVTHLYGTAAADSLDDTKGAVHLEAGNGNDKYTVTSVATKVVEAANGGTDTVFAHVNYTLGANLENLTLAGTATAGTGNNLDNTIKGNDLGNVLYGMGGKDVIVGGAGADSIYGGDGDDRITGGDGDDILYGDAGTDSLLGGAGNDQLFGGAGNDSLYGGGGIDTFTGGAGADKFIFETGDLGGAAAIERITDFKSAEGDKIALNGLDANVNTAADDKFTFIGTGAFTKVAGQLRYAVSGGDVHVMGDVNGDGVADFTIALTGVTKLAASDFIL